MRVAAERRVAVGFFDGVHLGHRRILAGADAVLTFTRHPLAVLASERAPALIMSLEERLAAIRACGPAEVTALDFTEELAGMSPDEFFDRHLRPHDRGGGLVVRCGADWRFGRGAVGGVEWLRGRGVTVEAAPFETCGGERISSSRIRSALAAGEVETANAMLGWRYGVSAVPAPGKGLGNSLGFATLNFPVALPLGGGVYEVTMDGARGLANYGFAPTTGASRWATRVLEVHLVGGWVETKRRDEPRRVEFLRFLRPERKFPDLAALKAQMVADCRAIGA